MHVSAGCLMPPQGLHALHCAQVRAYSRVFWERYTELNDYERITKNIERGEQRIQRQADIMAAIAAKLDRYRNPWQARLCLSCSCASHSSSCAPQPSLAAMSQ
jgi:SLIDE